MKIDEAIKMQEDYLKKPWVKLPYYVRRGMELGIAALKRVKLEHERDGVKVKWLLPGETKE